MWPFRKVCNHHRVSYEFKDLHRGADGELYFRHYATCKDCGERWCSAPRIPDAITEAIDDALWAGNLQRKEPRLQGIVRASIHAYNAGKRWEEYEPGYTEHERMAWEIGRAEVEKVKQP